MMSNISFKIMTKFFDQIAEGKKDYTLRIPDDKFNKMRMGDFVIAHDVSNEKRRLKMNGRRMELEIRRIDTLKKSDSLSSYDIDDLKLAYGKNWKSDKYLQIWFKKY